MEIDFPHVTVADLQDFLDLCIYVAFIAGLAGGFLARVLSDAASDFLDYIFGLADRQTRIADARWRGHWNVALREAREAGHKGRRAIAYAADAMKTRRQANADLRAHG
jgi:hypothetical protein